jgi:hypothetical protein
LATAVLAPSRPDACGHAAPLVIGDSSAHHIHKAFAFIERQVVNHLDQISEPDSM